MSQNLVHAYLTGYGGTQIAKADLQQTAKSLNQAQDTYKLLLVKRNELAKSVEKLKLMEAWQVCTRTVVAQIMLFRNKYTGHKMLLCLAVWLFAASLHASLCAQSQHLLDAALSLVLTDPLQQEDSG